MREAKNIKPIALLFMVSVICLAIIGCKPEEDSSGQVSNTDAVDGIVEIHQQITIGSGVVFNGTTPTNWTDLDLSSVVGSSFAFVVLKVTNNGTASFINSVAFRQNGDTGDYPTSMTPLGSNKVNLSSNGTSGMVTIYTDSSGQVEWVASSGEDNVIVEVVLFIK